MNAPPPTDTQPEFDAHALTVLEARYLLEDPASGARETPRDMLWRVARAVSSVESRWGNDVEDWARRFYRACARREFLPNSPTLRNAGRGDGQLSACFVLPVDDSLDAIFEAVKNAARIHGTGGGTGFSFSRLRPKDDQVGDRGRASGPVAFMRVFDAATSAVRQGGVRRGANMGILRVDHPDILEFVSAKAVPDGLSHFNISVAATETFMGALERGERYPLVNPRSGQEVGTLEAGEVWRALVESAWASGDPGLIFIDRINDLHPTPALGRIESTNPCGELPLLPFESCNLGSIDVHKHLEPEGGGVSWERLRETVHLAVRFLDDVIDANQFPLEAIGEMTRTTRKIGLGIMGWADALIELGIPYASQEALDLADRLVRFLLDEARVASRELAAERGPFPAWEGSRWEQEGQAPLRNATVTTIAPTGTIALLAGCSSGIEPLYALSYVRRTLDGQTELRFTHGALERIARDRGFWSEALKDHVAREGSLVGFPDLSPEDRALFQTAHEIDPAWHVRMQAAFQRHVENAVSKTVNLPNTATPDDVDRVYRLAYAQGCKGITIYRDGCRQEQVLSHPGSDPDAGQPPVCGGPECYDRPPQHPSSAGQ